MMQKISLALLFLLCISMLSSCGPRRYGCGPRRCEMKTQEQPVLNKIVEKKNFRFV
jgi:hypothetical protein